MTVLAIDDNEHRAVLHRRRARGRSSDCAGSKHASARRARCRAARRNHRDVFPQVTSGGSSFAAKIAVGYESYNDPLNKVDPLGLRPSDDTFKPDPPPDPMACAGVTNAPDFLGPNPHGGGATAQLYQFSIPVKYCKGVVRINGFISQHDITVGFGRVDDYMGDDRQFDSRSWAEQSRLSVELDFQRGLGRIFVNYSCHTDGRCESADPIGIGDIDITTSRNWSGFNEFSTNFNGDTMELKFNSANPLTRGISLAPCAITGKMTVDFSGDGDGVKLSNIVTRDFPSFEAYHYSGSRTDVLLQNHEHDAPDLCASRPGP